MDNDSYRRPKRGRTRVYDEAPTSTSYRRFTSNRSKTPLFERNYGKKVMETIYPMGAPPEISKRITNQITNLKGIKKRKLEGMLEKRLGVVSVALIAGSALFMIPNITGNVIWGLAYGKTNMLGAVFFVWGLAGLLFVLKQK